MKLKDIKLKTCPFCDGEGVLIHSKPDDGYIYSEGVHNNGYWLKRHFLKKEAEKC